MPQKVWTAKANGDIDYFNQKWPDYTGLSYTDLLENGWREAVHPADWAEYKTVWENSLNTGSDFQIEHRLRDRNGNYRWHLGRGIAQRNSGGAIIMWVGTNTDIHDQKVTEEELQTINASLKALIMLINPAKSTLDSWLKLFRKYSGLLGQTED